MIEVICRICGKHYWRRKSHIRAGCCSRKCGYKYQASKERSEEYRNKMRLAKRGHPVNEETKMKISLAQRGIPKSPEARGKIIEANNRLEHRMKIRHSKLGSKNPSWKGGRAINTSGYVLILRPDHPFCNCRGYVFESRIVMEQKLGRYLEPTEIVHHIDLDKTNNDPGNLTLFRSVPDHINYHRRLKQYFD